MPGRGVDMIYCYYALRKGSWWVRRIRAGKNPLLRIRSTLLWQTPDEAWEPVGDLYQEDYIMTRWEWHGETNDNGWWLLTHPQVAGLAIPDRAVTPSNPRRQT